MDMECYWIVNVILTDAERRWIWLSLLFNNTPCLPKHKPTIVLLYNECMLCISCHFRPLNHWRYRWIMWNYLMFWRHFPLAIRYYLVPCALQRHIWQTMQYVVILTQWTCMCRSAVVECLTQDWGAAGSSLTSVTALWSLSKTHLS